MARTLKALENGADPAEALQKLGNALTNKLIHPTTAAIRNAAAEDRLDQLDFIQNTYDLQVPTAEDDQAHQARPANSHDEES
jgi:glutamyl-tRNA reductase